VSQHLLEIRTSSKATDADCFQLIRFAMKYQLQREREREREREKERESNRLNCKLKFRLRLRPILSIQLQTSSSKILYPVDHEGVCELNDPLLTLRIRLYTRQIAWKTVDGRRNWRILNSHQILAIAVVLQFVQWEDLLYRSRSSFRNKRIIVHSASKNTNE